MLAALFAEDDHKPFAIRAAALVHITERLYIFLFHARKVFVQLFVEVIAAALPHGSPDTKAEDSVYFRPYAVIEDSSQVVLRVIDERQDG